MIEIRVTGTPEECKKQLAEVFHMTNSLEVNMSLTPEEYESIKAVAEEIRNKMADPRAFTEPAAEAKNEIPVVSEKEPTVIPFDTTPVKTETAVEEKAEEPAPVKEEPAPEITLVQARERLNGLRGKYGVSIVKDILRKLGFDKFTAIPSERYPELMVLCDAAEKGMEANA